MNHVLFALASAFVYIGAQTYLVLRIRRFTKAFLVQIDTLRAHGLKSVAVDKVLWFQPFVRSLTNSVLISDIRSVTLRQAEEDVYSVLEYELLQKLSIAAPLVGVILTAFGFFTIGGKLDDIQTLAAPLASGVFVGASLAIVNQFALVIAESSLQACRTSARSLIDQYWIHNASRLGDPQRLLTHVSERFDKTVTRLATLIDDFPTNAGAMTSRFSAIASMAEATFNELKQLSPRLQDATNSWATTAQQVSAAVDSNFLTSVDSLKIGSHSLSTAAQTIEGAIAEMKDVALQLQVNNAAQKESFQLLEILVQNTASWSKEAVMNFSTQLNEGIDRFAVPLKATSAHLSNLAPTLAMSAEILSSMTESTSKFSRVIETEFTPANQFIAELSRSSTELCAAVESLKKGLEGLEVIKSQHAEMQDAISTIIHKRAMPTVEVLQRATGTFEDSAHRIAECSEELAAAITLLLEILPRIEIRKLPPTIDNPNGQIDH